MRTSPHSLRQTTKTRKRPCRPIARLAQGCCRVVLWAILVIVGLVPAPPAIGRAQVDLTPESTTPSPPPRVAPDETAALKAEELGVVRTLARDFPNSVEPVILMGSVQRRHGNAAKAMALWEEALKRDPNRPKVHEDMGWFAMEKGQYEQAIEHWRKVLEIAPRAANIHSGIARALMGLNRHAEAIEELQKEIKVSPRSSFSWFLLGQEHLQLKEYEKAKASYEKAITLEPDLTNAYYGLFTVCSRLGQRAEAKQHIATFKKLKAADMEVLKDRNEAFNDLIDMRRDAAGTFMLAGQAYQANGNLERAEELMHRAASLAPQNPICHLHRAAIAMQLGHLAQAERAFRNVIQLAPKNARGYSGLAHLYLQAGQRLPQARQLAQRAVTLEPNAFHYYVLSWACDRNGDNAGAISAIKQAMKLEPGNPRYRRIAEILEQKN